MRCLIVEDDFISRKTLCRLLEPYGSADVAVDGEEAVRAVENALLQGESYELICLDIIMPGMDGQETLRQIRSLEDRHFVPMGEGARIVMTTSLEDRRNVMQAFRSLCDGYLVKPIKKKKLTETLLDLGLEIPANLGS